ncbi:MAG: DUF4160 domain-containing protein [Candidatus Protochlamydia sp.]|nr:DUF4160 domain-containing protein [Candidatus Protochlamydia sp.]
MQKICEFQDIQMAIDFNEKAFPQVRAIYRDVMGIFSIESGKLIDVLNGEIDDFPVREERLVNAWIQIHKSELIRCWQELVKDKNVSLNAIAPLQ